MTAPRQRILLVKLASLGDVVTTSTVITRIREEIPGAHVTWVVGRQAAPLVRLFDGVDDIVEVDDVALLRGSAAGKAMVIADLWRRLLPRSFDRVLIPHLDPRYRMLVPPFFGAQVRMFDQSRAGAKIPIPGRFIGDEAARLLDPPGASGYRPRPLDIVDARRRVAEVRLPDRVAKTIDGRRIDVALFPGGARNLLRDDHLRRWPVGHYSEAAKALLAMGRRVAILGAPSDAWTREAFAGIAVDDFIGQLDIPQTLRLLCDVGVVLSHDTGPLHFARLVRAKIVALFGPTDPRGMIGNPDGVTVLWGGARLPCRPCYDGRDYPSCARNYCMEEISPAQAVVATQAWLT